LCHVLCIESTFKKLPLSSRAHPLRSSHQNVSYAVTTRAINYFILQKLTYSKNPIGAMAPSSLLTGVALSADDLEVWATGLKAAAETARMQARRTRIVNVIIVEVEVVRKKGMNNGKPSLTSGGRRRNRAEVGGERQDGGVHARRPS
jgi:hypothetical protein